MVDERRRAVFRALCAEAGACRLCPRLADRAAVLSELNGALAPRVLFIAEAPGRQGADRTRIPMTGDASGRTFDQLLASIGLPREHIFITNAVMCSPRSPTGANRAPTRSEVRNCNGFLRRTIETLDPPVVATIGATGLAAAELLEPHGLSLTRDVGSILPWLGRALVPLYHPSPQVLVSRRSLPEQVADWQALAHALAARGYGH